MMGVFGSGVVVVVVSCIKVWQVRLEWCWRVTSSKDCVGFRKRGDPSYQIDGFLVERDVCRECLAGCGEEGGGHLILLGRNVC